MYFPTLSATLLLAAIPPISAYLYKDYSCCRLGPPVVGSISTKYVPTGAVSGYTKSCCAVPTNLKHSELGDYVSIKPRSLLKNKLDLTDFVG